KLPARAGNGDVHAIVETPRGARAKLKYEPDLGGFVLSKSLMLGLTYPYDWAFVPSTLADDGDPLDIMIIHQGCDLAGSNIAMPCHWGAFDGSNAQGKQRTQRSAVGHSFALSP